MNLTDNTILITGGSSGIGLELCKQFSKRNNRVIICGRSLEKLKKTKKQFPKIEIIQCDLAQEQERNKLIEQIKNQFQTLNVLINNAAIVNKIIFFETENILEMAEKETAINFIAPIHLIKGLYETIRANNNSNIINITTGLVYTPKANYPFYCPTKAALHSFTQVLRKQTESSTVKISEVLFPPVKTTWHKGNPPKIAISPKKAVEEMLNGLEIGKTEIRVGGAKLLYWISRLAPSFASKKVNELKNQER